MDRVSFYITIIFLVLILSPLSKAVRNIYNFIELCVKLSKKTMVLNDELRKLSPREFEIWCCGFLKGNDFEDIELCPIGPDSGVDIKCRKNEKYYYLECKRYADSSDAKYVVGVDIVKKLLGAMVGDGIKNGMIITTGNLTEEAISFIDTMPDDLSIKYFESEYFNIELYSLDYVPVIN